MNTGGRRKAALFCRQPKHAVFLFSQRAAGTDTESVLIVRPDCLPARPVARPPRSLEGKAIFIDNVHTVYPPESVGSVT